MNYALSKIVEHTVLIQKPSASKHDGEIVAQWGFGLEPKFNSPTEVEIYITAAMTPTVIDDDGETSEVENRVVEISVSHIFQLAEPHNLYPFSIGTILSEEEKMELATLVGVSVGTLRGLTYARTAAILGDSLIMPVLNPLEMLEHFLSVGVENT